MVIARCCPRWVSSVLRGPQPWVVLNNPRGAATLVYWSLAFGASLSDLFGADYPGRSTRVEVNWVYWVWRTGSKLYFKSFPPGGGIATCSDLWSSADWFERELWEMFGVPIRYHPDLRRLITDYGFGGHPLRKDFPVTGYLEVAYSEIHRRVVSKPVTLTQEFRLFDFNSPWLS